jgi:thiosulfate/3-mercaptopyruvate sulfurtransferase
MRSITSFVTPLLLLLLLPGLTVGTAFALQEEGGRSQAVALHAGTCQDLDPNPVHELGTSSPAGGDVTGALPDEEQQSIIGFQGAMPVAVVNATIGATFGDVFTDDPPHSVVVHEGLQPGENPVACGELGGVEDDGRIIVALQPVDDSRFAGVGVFDEDDAGFLGLGDDEVHVTVYILALDTSTDIDTATPEPVTVEGDGEGFANADWFVDAAWIDERFGMPIDEDADDVERDPVAVIGVFPIEEQPEAMIPNTVLIEPQALSPVSTTDEDIEEWRLFLMTRVMSARPALEEPTLEPGDMIVVYDDGSMHAAALWWALDYLGHDEKRMLEGGVEAWSEESEWATGAQPAGITGQPIDPDEIPESLGDGLNTDVLATTDDVEAVLEDDGVVLVDVRSAEEYAAGHIPGAVNIAVEENRESADSGRWAEPDQLRQLYADAGVAPDSRVIVYGGDGLNAHVTYFTLSLLGYEDVAVYPGGWVEWSQFPALPREQGE